MDRFKSLRIENKKYLLNALKYMDLNPVRAGLCKQPQDYKWSSFRHYAFGLKDPLLDPLPMELSSQAYLHLHDLLHDIKSKGHSILETTFFIGSEPWKNQQSSLIKNRRCEYQLRGG